MSTLKNNRFFTQLSAFSVLIAAMLFGLSASYAYAATPTLSLTSENNGYIQVTVSGDANSSVALYYYNPYGSYTSTPQEAAVIGSTNYYGSLSTSLNPSSYPIPANAMVYVVVDNQNSSNVQWPYYATSSNVSPSYPYNSAPYGSASNYSYSSPTGLPLGTPVGDLSFSQSSVAVAVGQTTDVGVYGTYSGIPFSVTSNSNSGVVSASASGSDINLTGIASGNSVITVCETGTNICNSISVYVETPGISPIYSSVSPYAYSYSTPTAYQQPVYQQPVYQQPIVPVSLSENGLSLAVGQSQSVEVYGSGSYYVYSNSNPSVASVNIGGSWISVSAGQPGSATITICENSGSSSCAELAVNVLAPAPSYSYNMWQPITYAVQPIIRPVERFFSSFPWRRSRI